MCYFFHTCCLNCVETGKHFHYKDCGDKKSCRKELFKFEPGFAFYDYCIGCSRKLNTKFNKDEYFYLESITLEDLKKFVF